MKIRRTIKEARKIADEKAKEQIDALQRATARKKHQAVLTALDRIMVRGRELVVAIQEQVWVMGKQGIHEHLLMAESLEGDLVVATIAEALEKPWLDDETKYRWQKAYAETLEKMAKAELAKVKAWETRKALWKIHDDDKSP